MKTNMETMSIYFCHNILDKTWLTVDNPTKDVKTDNISCATIFLDHKTAQEFAYEFNEQELEFGDFNECKQFLPKPDWDFDNDGELDGSQLSGPWIIKEFKMGLEQFADEPEKGLRISSLKKAISLCESRMHQEDAQLSPRYQAIQDLRDDFVALLAQEMSKDLLNQGD